MATTATETLRKQFELLQQQQLAKLERRKQLKEDKAKTETTANAAVSGSFGIEDDLQLKLSQPPSNSSSVVSEELVEHLNDQIRELKDENGRLYKLLSERDFEVRQLRKKREEDQLALAGTSGVATDAAATKIVELSKRVRELTSQFEAKKTEAKQLAARCMSLEHQVESANVQMGSPRHLVSTSSTDHATDQPKLTEADYRALQEKLKQAEVKATEYRNQVQSMRQDLKVAQKVIANEVGEGVTIQELLNSSSNWRGRAQQILALQKKISEMKGQLEQASSVTAETYSARSGRNSNYDLEAEFMGMPASRQRADDKHREALRKLEKDRKDALEKSAAELKALDEDYAALKQKFDAAKARHKTLSDEVKQGRDQIKRLEEKGKHDNELIEALIAREVQMKQMIDDITKLTHSSQDKQLQQITQLSIKAQQDTNFVDRLKAIVDEKESKIRALQEELELLKQGHVYDNKIISTMLDQQQQQQQQAAAPSALPTPHTSTLRHGSAAGEPCSGSATVGMERPASRRTPLPLSTAVSGAHGERDIDVQQYRSLAQAAQVERDKLMELLQVTNTRLDEANSASSRLQMELKQHKHKNVQLEKQMGRLKVDASQRKHAEKTKGKSSGLDSMDSGVPRNEEAAIASAAMEELETLLAIQRDENEALKAALHSTLEAKESDLRIYNEMLSETKAVFLQGLRNFKQQLRVQ